MKLVIEQSDVGKYFDLEFLLSNDFIPLTREQIDQSIRSSKENLIGTTEGGGIASVVLDEKSNKDSKKWGNAYRNLRLSTKKKKRKKRAKKTELIKSGEQNA